jgi:hypothetical protein
VHAVIPGACLTSVVVRRLVAGSSSFAAKPAALAPCPRAALDAKWRAKDGWRTDNNVIPTTQPSEVGEDLRG